jgi:hypothetical protein
LRWENAPNLREVIRLMRVMVALYCNSYDRPPASVALDIDDTLDVVHGHQQLSMFNAHYDERCFLPIHVYDTATSRPVAVLLRPGRTPSGQEIGGHLRRLVRMIRGHWPHTHITLRGDSHYARPEVMDFCDANGIDFVFGLAGNDVLRHLVEPAADDVRVRRAEANAAAIRRYTETRYGAKSWTVDRRVAARIEATTQGLDIRYVVTSFTQGSAEWLYDSLYCARGQAENLIKLHKNQRASDRTSCRSALANQVRLVLHTAAYWLMLTVRDAIPNPSRSHWRSSPRCCACAISLSHPDHPVRHTCPNAITLVRTDGKRHACDACRHDFVDNTALHVPMTVWRDPLPRGPQRGIAGAHSWCRSFRPIGFDARAKFIEVLGKEATSLLGVFTTRDYRCDATCARGHAICDAVISFVGDCNARTDVRADVERCLELGAVAGFATPASSRQPTCRQSSTWAKRPASEGSTLPLCQMRPPTT